MMGGRTRCLATLLLLPALATGCSVSRSMRVRSGEDPVYRDDDVRFRTTYYFRVFDACEGVNEAENKSPREDTVFRGKEKGPYQLRAISDGEPRGQLVVAAGETGRVVLRSN